MSLLEDGREPELNNITILSSLPVQENMSVLRNSEAGHHGRRIVYFVSLAIESAKLGYSEAASRDRPVGETIK